MGGLLGQLLASLTGQSSGAQQGNALLDLVTALIQNQPGGLAGLLQQFTAAGLGREASSWVSTGQNMPISAEQIAQVLGQGNVRTMGQKFNLSEDSASSGLASLLPAVIDHLTPQGQVDSETSLADALGALRGRFTA
jgi:uncharacterized protein YidB (DUF937 family)